MPVGRVVGPTGLSLGADSGPGRDSDPSGLDFSGLTKQFCPLPRTP
jgi:hypothetical protein